MKVRTCCPVLVIMIVLLPACGGESTPESGPTFRATVGTVPTDPLPVATTLPPSATPEPPTGTPKPPTNTPLPPTATLFPTGTPPPVTPMPPSPTHTAPPPAATPTTLLPTATLTTVADAAGVSPPPPAPTPSEAEIHFTRGLEHYRNEQWAQAIAEFQQVTKLDTTMSLAFGLLGYSYANGPGDFEAAIAALETYLQLTPEADDRAQVETDIATMRSILATQKPLPNLQVPPGKALFVFLNYTMHDWNVDVGPHFMQVPARPAGEEYAIGVLPLEPGSYAWQAHSPGGDFTITDSNGSRSFEISVVAGEIVTYEAR